MVHDLCRGEEARVHPLTRFLVVYELRAGGCPVRCPHVMVNGPYVLICHVAFKPSGFVSVVIVKRVRVVFRRGHVTALVRTGGIAHTRGVRGREGGCRGGWEGGGGYVRG